MSWSTFIIASLTVIALGYFVVKFWVELALIWIFLQTIFYLTLFSGVSAVLWVAFVENTTEGWQRTWTFFFIFYATIVGVIVCITLDLFKYGVDFIRDIFKIK